MVDIVNARLTRILVALALVLALVALHIALNRYTANASGLLALAAAGVFFTSWLSSMFWPRKFGSRLPAVTRWLALAVVFAWPFGAARTYFWAV